MVSIGTEEKLPGGEYFAVFEDYLFHSEPQTYCRANGGDEDYERIRQSMLAVCHQMRQEASGEGKCE